MSDSSIREVLMNEKGQRHAYQTERLSKTAKTEIDKVVEHWYGQYVKDPSMLMKDYEFFTNEQRYVLSSLRDLNRRRQLLNPKTNLQIYRECQPAETKVMDEITCRKWIDRTDEEFLNSTEEIEKWISNERRVQFDKVIESSFETLAKQPSNHLETKDKREYKPRQKKYLNILNKYYLFLRYI